ncbi:MAG: aminomethyl-transferring glycine dehydrogenase subunit GcvPA [Candidatus Zixiibacteriota bacterium]|nr:MAG: aminomethyl-transferring glycine dehydrogenase subunit GcvPA [candidate division Zixibacteria bacterium]
MSFISNSSNIRRRMLEEIGHEDFEDLIKSIPASLRLKRPLNLADPLSEIELVDAIQQVAGKNKKAVSNFTGGGAYDHFSPAAVDHILLRSEFYTAYTPYQAEVSQGTLQAIYEFQTFISRLTGLPATNASMYDGASALAEAVSLALTKTGRNEALISRSVNPFYMETVKTYLSGRKVKIKSLNIFDGSTDLEDLKAKLSEKTAAIVIQNPNFFGLLEKASELSAFAKEKGALFIIVYDPISLGVLLSPGECGADIAVAEGQCLGIPLNFGGPYLGLFSARQEFVRNIPGRLSGKTRDSKGRFGYVLTLQTREQHIRRERASSNICTNQALCALAATVYLSLLGNSGLEKIGRLCLSKAHYAASKISQLPGYKLKYNAPFFKEFVVETPVSPHRIITRLAGKGIMPGVDIGKYVTGLKGCLMIAVTEKRTRKQIDDLVFELSKFA